MASWVGVEKTRTNLRNVKEAGVVALIYLYLIPQSGPAETRQILQAQPSCSSIPGALLAVVPLLEQINVDLGLSSVTIDLTNAFVSIPNIKEDQKQFEV